MPSLPKAESFWKTLVLCRFNDLSLSCTLSLQALVIDPKCYNAYVLKGAALSLSDRTAESEQSFKAAIRLNPCRLEAYKGR